MDLPEVDRRVGRVWDEHTGGVHHGPSTEIAVYVATRPILIECRQGEWKRGAVPHRWWWEQQMDLDVNDAIGSDE